ncbi:MAG: NAD-dependent protein deacylase, partial [Dehalococcoidia bacterium]|nr:NAD-dependent protein deacylase [Dehalococcoidia bacterium]
MTEQLQQVASIIASARNLVAFTGSGISAESGIPTFRDPGGLWDRYDPDKLGTEGVATLGKITVEGRAFFQEMVDTLERARPNPGHLALAELERMGILSSVITQNIDNLHWEAGNTTIIEVH